MTLQAGTQVTPNVRLVRELGKGGMGSVWVAEHLRLDTQVAVKFILAEQMRAGGPVLLARFEREAKAAVKIKSAHVVQIFDHGIMEDGSPYIVMELLEGESLRERLARVGRMSPDETAQLVGQVSKALSSAHKLDVVHRDIKPDNIFLTQADDELLCKVLDFGIAKNTDALVTDDVKTKTGTVVGSPRYMSREQLTKPKEVDGRADLWALAVVAYEALTGRVPFHGETLASLMMMICAGTFEPPSHHHPDLPASLDAWFGKALHPQLDQRFASGKELAASFREAVVGGYEPATAVAGQLPAASHGATVPAAPATLLAPPVAAAGAGVAVGPAAEASAPGTFEGAAATMSPAEAGSSAKRLYVLGAIAFVASLAVTALIVKLRGSDSAGEESGASPATAAAVPSTATESSASSSAAATPAAPDGMVAVAAGEYWVGCDDQIQSGCLEDERPAHQETLRAFGIMRREVTMGEYDECVAAGACPPAGRQAGCIWQREGKEQHPINCVTWNAAKAYCEHHRWRLPTEAEWEAAARGAGRSAFPWGDELPTCDRAVVAEGRGGCNTGGPLAVESRPADRSWAAVFDLGGSMREWTDTDYAAYEGGTPDPHTRGKINKGASWRMTPTQAPRAYTRPADPADASRSDLGFRCAVTL